MYFTFLHNQKRDNSQFKTKNNQNCQKIEMYVSLIAKGLKENHTFRLVGGAEMGSWGGQDAFQGRGWHTGWSHIYMQIN